MRWRIRARFRRFFRPSFRRPFPVFLTPIRSLLLRAQRPKLVQAENEPRTVSSPPDSINGRDEGIFRFRRSLHRCWLIKTCACEAALRSTPDPRVRTVDAGAGQGSGTRPQSESRIPLSPLPVSRTAPRVSNRQNQDKIWILDQVDEAIGKPPDSQRTVRTDKARVRRRVVRDPCAVQATAARNRSATRRSVARRR